MAIDQGQVNLLLMQASGVSNTPRVFFVEPGNMMTALTWFIRITGRTVSLSDLSGNKASGGFYFFTHQDTIDGNQVNVTLRGGSSSEVVVTKDVYTMTRDYQPLSETHSETKLQGVPTLDITNPEALSAVPKFRTLQGRVEFKFTNRTQVEIAKPGP